MKHWKEKEKARQAEESQFLGTANTIISWRI